MDEWARMRLRALAAALMVMASLQCVAPQEEAPPPATEAAEDGDGSMIEPPVLLPIEVKGIWTGFWDPANFTVGLGSSPQCGRWTSEPATGFFMWQGRPIDSENSDRCFDVTGQNFNEAIPTLRRFLAGPAINFTCLGRGTGTMVLQLSNAPPGPIGDATKICMLFERSLDEVGPLLSLNWGFVDSDGPLNNQANCPQSIDDRDGLIHAAFWSGRAINDANLAGVEFTCQ